MVIVAPTALYNSILNANPSSTIPVTWVISSQDPPRSTITVPLLPWGVEIQPLPKNPFNPVIRPPDVGSFVFNVNYTNASKVGSGDLSYEAGQILTFDNETDITDQVSQINVPEVIDLQQNTNLLSLEKLGLTNEEIVNLETQTRTKMNALVTLINSQRMQANQKEIDIKSNQKLINENEKTLAAAVVVLSATDPIVIKLTTNNTLLVAQRTKLVDELNVIITEMNSNYNLLLNVKEIVR